MALRGMHCTLTASVRLLPGLELAHLENTCQVQQELVFLTNRQMECSCQKTLSDTRNCVTCRVGVDMPTVEVRCENLTMEAKVTVGSRALPTVLNSYRNFFEVGLMDADQQFSAG